MRSLAFTVTTMALGVSAHVLGGGQAPHLGVMALLFVVILLGAERFSRSECGGLTLSAGVLVTQLVIHLVCMDTARAGMEMTHSETRHTIVAHVVAAGLVATLLRHAESGVWRLRRWLGLLLPDVGLLPAFPLRRSTAAVGRNKIAGHGLLLAAVHGRRGPPRCC